MFLKRVSWNWLFVTENNKEIIKCKLFYLNFQFYRQNTSADRVPYIFSYVNTILSVIHYCSHIYLYLKPFVLLVISQWLLRDFTSTNKQSFKLRKRGIVVIKYSIITHFLRSCESKDGPISAKRWLLSNQQIKGNVLVK